MLRAEAKRVAVPALVPSDLLHPGWAGAEAEHARRLPAKVHLARIEVEVPPADELLARFAGRRPGFLVTTAAQIGGEAWLHLVRTLRVPAAVPEQAWIAASPGPAQRLFSGPHRAISSAGERCLHTAEVEGSKPPSPTWGSESF